MRVILPVINCRKIDIYLNSIWLFLCLAMGTADGHAATVPHQTSIETAWCCNDVRKISLRNISYKKAKSLLYSCAAVKQSCLYYPDLLLCFNIREQVRFTAACNAIHFTKQIHLFNLQKTIPGISADGVSAMTI